jgi:hypothetical protein
MVVFENRSAVNFLVHEHRKHRKVPFAGRHGVNHRIKISATNPSVPTMSRHHANNAKPWRET